MHTGPVEFDMPSGGVSLLPPPAPIDSGVPGTTAAFKPRHYAPANARKGDDGERLLAELLDVELDDSCIVLHNRCRPGTVGNIDHIVVAPSGVWVVDSKAWSGTITCKDSSNWDRPKVDLFVGTRRKTEQIAGIASQAAEIRRAIDDIGLGAAPVEEAVCFVSLDSAPSGMPHRVGSALAVSPVELVALILRSPHRLDRGAVQTIAHYLSATFPPKVSARVASSPDLPSLAASTRTERPTMARQTTFSADTKALVDRVAADSPLLHTVSQNKPNRIVAVRADGVIVETESSRSSPNGNALTPAWMIEVAWAHLRATGRLEQSYLVANDGLNVKRSAFVMALISRFPGVSVTLGPACLHYRTPDA